MKTILTIVLACFCFTKANSAGVTIITHGYAGDVTGWITAMANEIPTYFNYRYPGLSTNFTIYTVTLTTDGSNYYYQWARDSGSSPSNTDTGEIIVMLDWSQMAGGLSAPYDISTSNVAWVVSYVLSQTNTIADLNGHALAEFPIHLIGHSRGGSLISEVSRLLGTNGIWVDHLTTLDPHPLNNDGNIDPVDTTDAPVRTYANVLFADNYWEDLGDSDPPFLDPHGEPVAGAYIQQLTELTGGYANSIFDIFNDPYEYHSNVHLWYYGTLNLNTPASYNFVGDAATIDTTMRTSWWVPYEDEGVIAGFYYSLIGGGNRMSTVIPLGLPSYPTIVSGYNQNWDLGAGTSVNRTALPSNSGTWPNIIKFDVIGTNIVKAGSLISTKLYYQYGGSSNLTAQIYFDRDFNPYSTNSVSIVTLQPPATGTGSVYFYSNIGLTTTNVPPGVYAIYAKMTDGVHTRYLYTPELVQIISNLQPPTLDIQKSGGAQFIIGINGVSGQKIILQTSSSLQNWTSLATNTLTTSRWTYTNSLPASQQFYRAVLSQ